MTLGERIRRARKALGMTQEELAGREFSKSFISQVERGMVNPSLASLHILASRLNVPISELVESQGQRPQPGPLCNLAEALLALGRVGDALPILDQVRDLLREWGNPAAAFEARLYRLSGLAHLKAGRTEEAIEAFDRAVAIGAAKTARWEQVLSLQLLGETYLSSRLYLKAAKVLEQALATLDTLEQGYAAAAAGVDEGADEAPWAGNRLGDEGHPGDAGNPGAAAGLEAATATAATPAGFPSAAGAAGPAFAAAGAGGDAAGTGGAMPRMERPGWLQARLLRLRILRGLVELNQMMNDAAEATRLANQALRISQGLEGLDGIASSLADAAAQQLAAAPPEGARLADQALTLTDVRALVELRAGLQRLAAR